MDVMRDGEREEIVAAAYRDVVASGRYRYRGSCGTSNGRGLGPRRGRARAERLGRAPAPAAAPSDWPRAAGRLVRRWRSRLTAC